MLGGRSISSPYEMMVSGSSRGLGMGYIKALAWSTAFVALLTFAQYGSVHLLSARPASWLFEASLDLAPPLLFAGDIAQSMFNHDSQAPLREQLPALGVGLLINICAYGVIVLGAKWLFFGNCSPSTTFREVKPRR